MSASFMSNEELAITVKFPVYIRDIVLVVIAMEGKFELIEPETGAILCIAFCLFQFADQSIVHR